MTSHDPEIRVNPALVRANEVHRLCGDPRRLRESFVQQGTPWALETWAGADGLRGMLEEMLAAYRDST